MRVAVCQLNARDDRAANLKAARRSLERAAALGADLAVLPEYTDYLGRSAGLPPPEAIDGEFASFFADAARELGIWVLAGSFHEAGPDADATYNTSLVFDRAGALAATYRKIHLYDVEIPGRVSYQESATVAPGVDRGGRSRRGRAGRPVDLLRPALPGAVPVAGRRRRGGAGGAGGVHDAHRARPLGGAAARAGDREPVLRAGGGPDRRPRAGRVPASGAAWWSTRGARWWPRRPTR